MKLSRFVTGILAVALIAFMVSDVQAQRRGQGGGGRGGQGGAGRGGPGGGGPGGGFGGGDPTMGLLRVEEVQEELEISPKQKEALEKMAERSRGERPDFSGVREMSEEDRNKLFEKMRKDSEKRTAEMKDQLIEVLLPQQMDRLDEISLQVRGVQALSDPEVAGKLKITEAQKKELAEVRQSLQESMRERMREMFSGGGGGGDPREAFGKIREEMEKEVLGVLDTSQQKKFEEMKGEKFEMPEGATRGFGGGGGFGGRGGGGRPGGGGEGGGGRPGGRRGGEGGGERRGRPESE